MTKTTIDIQAFINEHPFTRYQWMILALCFITVAMDGFDTAIIGFIASDLVQEWGVEKSALGPVMSAALVGLAVGALTAGPLADRIGRKKVLIMSIVVFGGFSLLTAFATSLNQLTLLRFLTGLGLGAAMPNAATLMSEYAPERRRALLVNLMFVGFPMGSSLGGFLSAWMIPHYGWQSVLVLGGVMPLLLAVALIFLLPESVRYLVVKQHPAQRIAAILRRIAPLPKAVEFVLREAGHFTLKLDDGSTAESTRSNGKPALFRLGDTSLSEGLEQQLLGLKEGEKKAFSLEPDAAFGVPSPDLIQYFSRREFIDAGEPEIGAIMLFTAMDGSEMPGVIREVNGDSITVDFNHPLAGRTVHFDIEVLEIDPALEE